MEKSSIFWYVFFSVEVTVSWVYHKKRGLYHIYTHSVKYGNTVWIYLMQYWVSMTIFFVAHSEESLKFHISNVAMAKLGELIGEKTKRNMQLIMTLIQFSLMLCFIEKPVISFTEQNKWLVSIWNATLDWNGLIDLFN